MAKAALSDEGLVFVTYADVEVLPPFVDLGMVEDLVRSVYAYGCQQRAILSIVKGCDVTVLSATGKRCVFALVAWLSVTAMTAKSGTCNLHVLTMSLMLEFASSRGWLASLCIGEKARHMYVHELRLLCGAYFALHQAHFVGFLRDVGEDDVDYGIRFWVS